MTTRTGRAAVAALAAAAALIGTAATASAGPHHHGPPAHRTRHAGDCALANGIKHVIQIQFDNVHLTRDNPNVASDLEQMPHLLHFLERNGVVLANTHDVLSHTATNFIANQTGLYPDRNGVTQSNTFNYYGQAGQTHPGVSFAYWTDPIYDYTGNNTDQKYNAIYAADRAAVPNHSNVNVPAPWVPYTRAGCNVGEVGMANTVLENTSTDINTVFGPDSPAGRRGQATIRRRRRRTTSASPSTAARTRSSATPGTLTCCPTSRAATTATRPCSATPRSSRPFTRPGR